MPFIPTRYIAQAIGKKSLAAWKCFTASALEPKQLTYFSVHHYMVLYLF